MQDVSKANAHPQPELRDSRAKAKRKPKQLKRNKRAEARRRGRERSLAERQRLFEDLSRRKDLPDFCVLTQLEWGSLNSLSPRQVKRILASGDGPPVVWLSAKRRGITIGANRAWQQARVR